MKKLKIKQEDDITFEQGFEEFIDNCNARNLRPATLNHYRESFKSITRFVDKNLSIKDIKQSTVDKFVRDCKENLEANTQTIYTYTRDLKTILYFFMRLNWMKEFKIKLPQVDKKAVEVYTDIELKALLKKPDLKKSSFVEYRNWVSIKFFLSTAVRLNSFINVKVKDLDFENEVVYVNVTKNRKPLIIPLNKDIIKILKEYLKIRQYSGEDDYLFCTCYGKQLNKKTLNGSLNKYNRDRNVYHTGIIDIAIQWLKGL
ncbi:site-specific integrase [Clostridium sp.]|uniref:tyrosine-type recombinase/integrase n=1 Tax=Clostridium sp. TaxID=1506 RepID=UPI00284BD8E3|nr:site-specific integrase [Clostridium sp.]MDR3597844.1 site-specific integrase [Clostridium sp.]